MRIVGEWLVCDDLVCRPCVRGRVAGAGGSYSQDDFLIDTGADRTVFVAGLLAKLGIPTATPSLPIFLSETRYIPVPLEATYMQAWGVFPTLLKQLIEPRS